MEELVPVEGDATEVEGSEKFIAYCESPEFLELRDSFSPEQVHEFVSSFFEAALSLVPSQESDTKEDDMRRYFRYESAFMRFLFKASRNILPVTRKDKNKDNFTDLILKELVNRIGSKDEHQSEYLVLINEYLNTYLLQNPHMIRTETYYDCLTDVLWKSELDFDSFDAKSLAGIQDSFLRWTQYLISFKKPEIFVQELRSRIAETMASGDEVAVAKLIELIRIIGSISQVNSWSESGYESIITLFRELEDMADNYLNKSRVHAALVYLGKDTDAQGFVTSRRSLREFSSQQQAILLSEGGVAPGNLEPERPVARLAPGLVGLYGMKGDLEKFIPEELFRTKPFSKRNAIGELPVFTGLLDSTQDISVEEVKDISYLFSLPFRRQVQEDFGIDLGRLDIRVQYQFLHFLKGAPIRDAELLAESSMQYGESFFVAFLSLEKDPGMGNLLVREMQELDHDEATLILEAYAGLVKVSDEVASYLGNIVEETVDWTHRLVEEIRDSLLDEGRRIIKSSFSGSEAIQTITKQLNKSDASLRLFLTTIKAVKAAQKDLPLEQIPGLSVDSIPAKELDKETRESILRISDENWSEKQHMRESISAGLRKSLEMSGTNFTVIRHNGKVIAFFRLDHIDDDELYFGSVNVAQEAQGYALAPAMLQQMFLKEAEGKLVTAHCNPWDRVTSQYIGDCGFMATKLLDYSGQPAFEIVRDGREHDQTKRSHYAGLSFQELASQVIASDQIHLYTFKKDPGLSEGDEESARFISETREQFDHGMVITNFRYGLKNADGSIPVAVAFESMLNLMPPPKQTEPETSYTQTATGASV